MAGDVVAQSGEADAGQQAISPQRLAHFVLRTSRFEELVDWYQTVLGATPAFKNELLAFLSYDEEHHRVAILNVPGLQPQPERSEEHTSELQSLMRNSYAVFCLKKKKKKNR